jgi:hypothetical protein
VCEKRLQVLLKFFFYEVENTVLGVTLLSANQWHGGHIAISKPVAWRSHSYQQTSGLAVTQSAQ